MLRCALSSVAPKERQYLCADALFRLVRSGFATIADDRDGDAEIALPDARRSAFAMVSLKSPALLAVDKQRAEGHWGTIYGIEHVPNDGERNAAKRFMAKWRQDHPPLEGILTEASLSSHAPHLETLHDDGRHAILGGKEGDQASLFTQVQAGRPSWARDL